MELKHIKVFKTLSLFGRKESPILERLFANKSDELEKIFNTETTNKIQKTNKSCVVTGTLLDGTRCFIEVTNENS